MRGRVGRTVVFAVCVFPSLLLVSPAAGSALLEAPRGAERELASQRTVNSKTWKLRNGSRVTRVAAGPIHWREEGGAWRGFDFALKRQGGSLEARAGQARLSLPATLSSGRRGSVRVGTVGGWVEMGIERARGSAVVRGATATYPQALPGVDLEHRAVPEGLKETLTLLGPTSKRSFAYRIRLSAGLVPRVDRSGAIAVEREGTRVFRIPAATITDARGSAGNGPTPAYDLKRIAGSTWRLSMRIDDVWLNDKRRAWPVTVDPTVTTTKQAPLEFCATSDVDSYVSDIPDVPAEVWTADGCNDPNQQVVPVGGFYNGATAHRDSYAVWRSDAELRFGSLSGYLATDDIVDSAKLVLHVTDENLLSNQGVVAAPISNTATAQRASRQIVAPDPQGGALSYNVTNVVNDWQANRLNSGKGYPNRGLQLFTDAERLDVTHCMSVFVTSCANGYTGFASATAVDPNRRPYLEVKSIPSAPAGSKIVTPGEGAITGRRVPLVAHAPNSSVNSVRFQYVAGEEREWSDIPLSALRYAVAQPGGGTAVASSNVGVSPSEVGGVDSKRVVWDMHATPGGNVDGSVHVRAVFDGPSHAGVGVSPEVNFRLDRNNPTNAAISLVGPGSVDLLTGDYTVGSRDVEVEAWLAKLGVSRTYHSRGVSRRDSEMFGPHWAASVEGDGGRMSYKGLYNFSEVNEEQVTTWTQAPQKYRIESTYDFGDDEEPDPQPIYLNISINQWNPSIDIARWKYEYAQIEAGDGGKFTFKRTTNPSGTVTGWEPDDAHAGFKLTEASAIWTLVDPQGNTTTFERDAPSSPVYRPTAFTQPGSTKGPSFSWTAVGDRKRLTRVTAPSPNGAANETRYLKFNWVTDASTGNQPRVKSILFGRWTGSAVTESTIAEYGYDSAGRLTQMRDPRIATGLATNYAYDAAGRLESLAPPGEAAWRFVYGSSAGDDNEGRLRSVRRARPGLGDAVWTVKYDVPLGGSGAPYDLRPASTALWGQVDDLPTDATAVFRPSQAAAASAGDYSKATVHYLDARGQEVNTAEPGGSISTTQYDENRNVDTELSAANRERALASSDPPARAAALSSIHHYASNKIDELWSLSPERQIKLRSGETVTGRTKVVTSYDEGRPDPTVDYHLRTSVSAFALYTDSGGIQRTADVQHTAFGYDHPSGVPNLRRGWEVRQPTKVVVDPDGLALTTTSIYDDTLPLVREARSQNYEAGKAGHRTRYYYWGIDTAAGNCPTSAPNDVTGRVGLLCRVTEETAAGDAPLPVRTLRFNSDWQETEVVETTPSGSRTNAKTYDAIGRVATVSVSGGGAAVPDVTMNYDAATGKPTTMVTAAIGGAPQLASGNSYDTNGRIESYVDSTGEITTTTFNLDGEIATQTDSKGTTTLGYGIDGLLTSSLDSTIGSAITASYDADGSLTEQRLPNGLTAKTSYDTTGMPVGLEYVKAGCSTDCKWVESQVERDAQGHWAVEKTGAGRRERRFRYDGGTRLARVEDVAGDGTCTTREYRYDAESNRTSRRTYPATSGSGGCTTSTTPSIQALDYDSAGRVQAAGAGVFAYDPLGQMTAAPASAIGSDLTSSYFADGQAKTLVQGGVTQTYARDPLGRVRTRASSDTGLTRTDHYNDGSDVPAWSAEGASWTRYVDGVDGNVLAETKDGTTTYLLTDLHGDVVARTSSSSAATAPVSRSSYDEFGVPTSGPSARYGSLGGAQRSIEFDSGVTLMGVRTYLPQLGRFMQTDPVAKGAANRYDYAFQDPVNRRDLDGRCLPLCVLVAPEAISLLSAAAVAVLGTAVVVHAQQNGTIDLLPPFYITNPLDFFTQAQRGKNKGKLDPNHELGQLTHEQLEEVYKNPNSSNEMKRAAKKQQKMLKERRSRQNRETKKPKQNPKKRK